MKISRSEQSAISHNAERVQLEQKRMAEYIKVAERRKFDEITAERVQRNIRLGADKGRNLDLDV
jgi:hypothetical protein